MNNRKDILESIEVLKREYPLTEDYIDILNLNDITDNELISIYKEYAEIAYSLYLEDKRLKNLKMILSYIEFLKENESLQSLSIPTLEDVYNYTSVSLLMLIDGLVDIIMDKYELNSDRREDFITCYNDVLDPILNGKDIPYMQLPINKFMSLLDNKEFPYENMEDFDNDHFNPKMLINGMLNCYTNEDMDEFDDVKTKLFNYLTDVSKDPLYENLNKFDNNFMTKMNEILKSKIPNHFPNNEKCITQ